ncbi:MAG: TRAP transporter small permease [Cyclobacteriaceae bacterium]|nr:TRAP transporter small permease [Cyclobacteriaceae bacterium]
MKAKIDRLLELFLTLLMGLLVLDVVWQVFSRYVLKNPSSFTDELARYLMIWLALFGSAYLTGRKDGHLSIDLLPERIKTRTLALFIQGIVFLFSLLVLVIGGSRHVQLTLQLNQTSASLRIPMGYVYLALPVSGLLACFYSGYAFFHLLQPKRTWKD